MKKILFFASLLAFAACSGTIDPEQNQDGGNPDGPDIPPAQEIPEEFTGPYTLEVDKSEVEASGEDYVTFKLLDAYDRDVLADRKALQNVNIVSEEGLRVPRMETKTRFIANGTYRFTARYNGVVSENTVEVTAVNRGRYEKFHKNVAIYKATATWCQYCPSMTAALEGMSDDSKAHSIELCWHNDDSYAYTVPGYSNDCGALVAAYLNDGAVALPTVVLDAVEMVSERSSSTLNSEIWNLRADYPATCGIKVSTEYAGGKLSINAELTSVTGGQYDMGCAILLNNQTYSGGTAKDGKYSHIVMATTPNYLMYSTSIKEVAKDGSLPFEMNVDLNGISTANLSVAVFALVKHENAARIDNIVEVKAGESIDYVYNE